MTNTTKNTAAARRHAAQADSSQRQSDLYRNMAETLRRQFDPTYQDATVCDEVARLTKMSHEMDEDAEYERELALAAGYVPE